MNLEQLIGLYRSETADQPNSNFSGNEVSFTPANADGVTTNFRLSRRNIVDGTLYITVGTTFRTQSGFDYDPDSGYVTFFTAPAANVTPFWCDFYWQWNDDAQVARWLVQGAQQLGGQQAVYDDPTLVQDQLIPALIQFAAYHGFNYRAANYAYLYASSGGGQGQTVDVVTKNFYLAAKACLSAGQTMRDDYYKRAGQSLAPAWSFKGQYHSAPITPRY